MNKNFTREKKLMQYAASAIAFLTVGSAKADVIYVDVDPDSTIGGEGAEMTVDINADGVDDFQFNVYILSGSGTYYGFPFTYQVNAALVKALNENELMGSVKISYGYTFNYLPVLTSGLVIDSTENFVTGIGTLGASLIVMGIPYYQFGVWLGAEMSYMGFRLVSGDNNYYGWMRLSVDENATGITLHDYAYQSNVNQGINAGQLTGINGQEEIPGVKFYSFEKNIHITVSSSSIQDLDLKIFNLAGELVKQLTNVRNNQVVDCSDLVNGNYIIQVTDGTSTMSRQFFLGE